MIHFLLLISLDYHIYKALLILNLITEFIDKIETTIKSLLEMKDVISSNSASEINKTDVNTSFNTLFLHGGGSP